MNFKVYYFTESECIEVFKTLSMDGYNWHLGTLTDEPLLVNNVNQLNYPKQHNIVHVDRKNKYVYSSSYLDEEIAEKKLKNLLLYEKGYLDFVNDEEEYRYFESSKNKLKFILMEDDYNMLNTSLSSKIHPYSLDELSKAYFFQELLNNWEFMNILTSQYVSEDEPAVLDKIILNAFEEWEMNPSVDIEQFRIEQL